MQLCSSIGKSMVTSLKSIQGGQILAKYTPMIEQYLDIKKQHEDSILLFRLGDFYEMFFQDAETASRELELVLTARDGGSDGKVPMCGVPHHAVSNYIAKLVNRGYKVAICDQVEDPKQAKGIVKREVTRIITPGTIMEEFMLDESCNNYLAAVIDEGGIIGFSYIDISTGGFWVTELSGEDRISQLFSEMQRISPAECLIPSANQLDSIWQDHCSRKEMLLTSMEENELSLADAKDILLKHFAVAAVDGLGLQSCSSGIMAAGAIISSLYQTQKTSLKQVQKLHFYQSSSYMNLDAFTRRNLELTSTMREGKKSGSLLGVMDLCSTPMGKRLLRKWLEQPLMRIDEINQRLDSVEELFNSLELREESKNLLRNVHDLERLAGRLGSGMISPRELLALKNSLQIIPEIKELLSSCDSHLLGQLSSMDSLQDVYSFIDTSIDDDAPSSLKDGGIIKTGYNQEIDELKKLSSQGKDWLVGFESRERERSGIKNLKVGYNKVFGYYVEISKANIKLVPADYIRKQTLVNNERYITEELKEYEDKIMNSREKLFELEYNTFLELRKSLEQEIGRIQATALALAALDVLTSLAQLAFNNDYVRPELKEGGNIDIKAGRHPVVEKALHNARFVPNDVRMDMDKNRFAIITGPNMGGKSTFMRQVALVVIMAQVGSFVPADEANIGIVDRIFTRVGASDDLAAGQSTFMVEMVELANILNSAGQRSLIILDEIGRGTSTYDGLSIAQAVSEYINEQIAAKTLFATHYHELTRLAENNSGMYNLSVSVVEDGETVSFLKKVLPGKADKSYGIHVAKLAGLPRSVIKRSYQVLSGLENEESSNGEVYLAQASLFPQEKSPLLDELEKLNIDEISPKEALMILYKWKAEIS